MSLVLNFEKSKVFKSVPFVELIQAVEAFLEGRGLEITRRDGDDTKGIIEASKRVSWPFKSRQEVIVTVKSEGKVTVVEKLDVGKRLFGGDVAQEDVIMDALFKNLKDLQALRAQSGDT